MTRPYAPIPDTDWPEAIADMRDGFAGRLNVYRTMAHHPALLRAWSDLRDRIVVRSALSREESEIVILRTGHRLDAAYEWAHHVVRGRAAGLSDARINSLRGPLEAMADEDRIYARAVDELIDGAMLAADTLAAVEERAGPTGVLDLMATVGFYTTLAFVVKTFDVPIDADIPAAP